MDVEGRSPGPSGRQQGGGQAGRASRGVARVKDFSVRGDGKKIKDLGHSIKLTLAASWSKLENGAVGERGGYCSDLGGYLAWSRGSRDEEICVKNN